MLEHLDAGPCIAIATGIFDVENNPTIPLGNGCKHGIIVSIGSLVLEKPLALPACTGYIMLLGWDYTIPY